MNDWGADFTLSFTELSAAVMSKAEELGGLNNRKGRGASGEDFLFILGYLY